MKDKSDPSGLYGNHRAGVWNEAQRKEATQINNALKYWQDLACANRKVAEDAQAQRDKAVSRYELVRKLSPRQFSALWECCMVQGVRFDEAVDAKIEKECGK